MENLNVRVKFTFEIGDETLECNAGKDFLHSFLELYCSEGDDPKVLAMLLNRSRRLDVKEKILSNPHIGNQTADNYADKYFQELYFSNFDLNRFLLILANPSMSGEKLDEIAKYYAPYCCSVYDTQYEQILEAIIGNPSTWDSTLEDLESCEDSSIASSAKLKLFSRRRNGTQVSQPQQ